MSAIADRLDQTIQRKIMKYMHENETIRYIDVIPKLVKKNTIIHTTNL